MRCARCDRLAVPQAVGRSPDDLVVFGWCLDCLEEVGCTEIEAADCLEEVGCTEIEAAGRRPAHRGMPRALSLVPTPPSSSTSAPDRRRLVLGVASLLGAWSIVLIAVGIWVLSLPEPPGPSPLGNGRPMLFLAGGLATAATSLLLLGLSQGRDLLRSRQACWWVQSGSFLIALAILAVGIAYHDPRRDPFVVAAAGLATGLSVVAHWHERRLPAARSTAAATPRDRLQRH